MKYIIIISSIHQNFTIHIDSNENEKWHGKSNLRDYELNKTFQRSYTILLDIAGI